MAAALYGAGNEPRRGISALVRLRGAALPSSLLREVHLREGSLQRRGPMGGAAGSLRLATRQRYRVRVRPRRWLRGRRPEILLRAVPAGVAAAIGAQRAIDVAIRHRLVQ